MRFLAVVVIVLSLVCSIQAVSIAARRRLEARRADLTERLSIEELRRKAIAANDCSGLVADFKNGCSADASDLSKCGTSITSKQWDGSSDASKGYVKLSKSPAPTILGGGKEISAFCGKNLVGSKAPQCVASDGSGFNRLTLWGSDWSVCVNWQWVHCAAAGKLPQQGGATFIFPGVVPSGMNPPADPSKNDASMTMLEFCSLAELCSNGSELFTIAVSTDPKKPWTCKAQPGKFVAAVNKFTSWIKSLVKSPHAAA